MNHPLMKFHRPRFGAGLRESARGRTPAHRLPVGVRLAEQSTLAEGLVAADTKAKRQRGSAAVSSLTLRVGMVRAFYLPVVKSSGTGGKVGRCICNRFIPSDASAGAAAGCNSAMPILWSVVVVRTIVGASVVTPF